MIEEWGTNSFCVSANSSNSGQFSKVREFQDLNEDINSSHRQCDTFMNRFIAYENQKSQTNLAMGVFLRNLKPIPMDPFIDPIFSTCFNCWQFGHRYQECNLPKNHKFCVNCGRMNVVIDSCPRCDRAYRRYLLLKEFKPKKEEKVSVSDDFGYDYGDETTEDDIMQFEARENRSDNCSISFSKTSTANSSDEQCSYSLDQTENYSDDVIVDEDERSHQPVSDLVRDFLKLLNNVKHWPIEVQNTLLLHFVTERRNNQPQ